MHDVYFPWLHVVACTPIRLEDSDVATAVPLAAECIQIDILNPYKAIVQAWNHPDCVDCKNTVHDFTAIKFPLLNFVSIFGINKYIDFDPLLDRTVECDATIVLKH